MKRVLIFFFVLALALGGGYLWWQANATRIITAQVQQLARGFFVDAAELTVHNDPIKIVGLTQARVPKLTISGQHLHVRNGPEITAAKLTLTDLDVTGPPIHCTGVGEGAFTVTVSQEAATKELNKRGIPIPLSVTFSRKEGTKLAGEKEVIIPLVNTHLRIPFVATGKQVAASKNGQVDFRVDRVTVAQAAITIKQVTDALAVINPVIDVSDWPFVTDITPVTNNGSVTLHGKITGVR